MSTVRITAVPLERVRDLVELAEETFVDTYADKIDADVLVPYARDVFVPDLTDAVNTEASRALWVCEDERPVGYMTLQMVGGPGDSPTARMDRLYVRASHRGRGLGRDLMNEAIRLGRLSGRCSLQLGVWESNTAAIAFYEHVGFRTCGEETFVMGDDRQRDILMCLSL